MPNDWARRRLVDVAEVVGRGITPSYSAGGEALVINQRCIRDGLVLTNAARRHDVSKRQVAPAKKLRTGDVLVNSTGVGTLGRTGYVAKTHGLVTVDSHVTILRPKADTASRWLGYMLRLLEPQIEGLAEGSTGQTELNRERLGELEVLVPPLSEQVAIGDVLGSFDARIESNQRLRVRAEEVARLVLVAGLKSASSSWEWASAETVLAEVLAVLETGGRPRGGVGGILSGVPSIGAESISQAGVFDFGKSRYIPRDFFEQMRRGRLEDRDVLLYKDGGRPGQFEPHVSLVGEGFPFAEAAINEHVYRLRIDAPYSQDFLYFWLRSERVMEEMRRRGTGVAIPGLNSSNVRALPVIAPDKSVLQELQSEIAPLMTLVLRKARETSKLVRLRDSYAPELLSGRSRAPQTDI